MRAFRIEGDELVAEVDPGEQEVLASVLADVAELLGAGRLEDRVAAGSAPGAAGGSDVPAGLGLRLDPMPTPDDPAVHRLLPDASRDDPEVSAEFRRLTEDDLRQQKIDRLAELYRMIAPARSGRDGRHDNHTPRGAQVRVVVADGPRVAATINDVRLVLGERLDITDEEASAALEREVIEANGAPTDQASMARHYLGTVFLALGWWQETLMACLLARLDRPG